MIGCTERHIQRKKVQSIMHIQSNVSRLLQRGTECIKKILRHGGARRIFIDDTGCGVIFCRRL
jgi:hypothetical protein